MTRPSLRFAPLLVTAGLALLSGSCGSGGTAPPTAWVQSTLGLSTINGANNGACNIGAADMPFFTVGTLDNPVPTGGSFDGSPITVSCQVSAMGSGFNVQLNISEGQQYTLQITGTLNDTPGQAQTGIDAFFGTNVESYGNPSSMPCTVTLTTEATNDTPIAAGRVWGTLNCPAVTDTEANNTCAGTASFIFENCAD